MGELTGVLGILFDWDSLAQTIVKAAPLPPKEKVHTRVCITDDNGLLLADSQDQQLQGSIEFEGRGDLFKQERKFTTATYEASTHLIAHALSPGYETYATGWHSVILQRSMR